MSKRTGLRFCPLWTRISARALFTAARIVFIDRQELESFMFAKIYQPSASAMQSGRGNTQKWVLEFVSRTPTVIDPLTGTARSTNMRDQLSLKFDSLEDAVSYAKGNKIPYRVSQPKTRKRISRSYAENFAYDRKLPWTH